MTARNLQSEIAPALTSASLTTGPGPVTLRGRFESRAQAQAPDLLSFWGHRDL